MVIRMRHTRAHTKNRRSHHALKTPTLAVCKNCGASHRPHHMCLECGFYNGRQVMDLKAKKEARDARIKAKQERIRLQQQEMDATEAETVSEAEPSESAETPEEKK
ncbi:MAG: 50S ribosomal protein L32 [Candidatus Paceibacterota bacterium]